METPLLQVKDINVFYGHSHVLQGVSLEIPRKGLLAIVGRNGMGKTTLCDAIMGMIPIKSGSIRLGSVSLQGLDPYKISELGVGYVPQGRRVWPSLTVEEHLKLAASKSSGKNRSWNIDKIYDVFPRLHERSNNTGSQLSGGEQQMLAISRALLGNPKLLIMDEPTEGLAPVIIEQVENLLLDLSKNEDITILLVEQNLNVVLRIAKKVAIMVNGLIEVEMDTEALATDHDLQKSLLGVGLRDEDQQSDGLVVKDSLVQEEQPFQQNSISSVTSPASMDASVSLFYSDSLANLKQYPSRFTHGNPLFKLNYQEDQFLGIDKKVNRWSNLTTVALDFTQKNIPQDDKKQHHHSLSTMRNKVIYVVGTFDTKKEELFFIRDILNRYQIITRTVDLSTASNYVSEADISPKQVAQKYSDKIEDADFVFTGDRGSAVHRMTIAFKNYLHKCTDIAGVISIGGSGGTALVAPALQQLPIGLPKVLVSTVASGNTRPYVGASDICMIYSVTDFSGINRISKRVLTNATNALLGMLDIADFKENDTKPTIGLTMFGVTTEAINQIIEQIGKLYECLVFHATGTGGQSMEKLVDSDFIFGLMDITTTEICDLLMGGVLSAGEDRLGCIIRKKIPYVGSCGALDMVNFGALDTVPDHYKDRNLYKHNDQVTLMRTTVAENQKIGAWIGNKLNQSEAPIRFLLPEGGVSALDAPNMPFYDPDANKALFTALEDTVQQTSKRKLIRVPFHINNSGFVDEAVKQFKVVIAEWEN